MKEKYSGSALEPCCLSSQTCNWGLSCGMKHGCYLVLGFDLDAARLECLLLFRKAAAPIAPCHVDRLRRREPTASKGP